MSAGSDKQIILHVGLHKTATTFLQAKLFPALAGVRFVHPMHYPRPDDGPIDRFVLELLFRNPVCVDVEAHRRAIEAWLAEVPEPTVLISSEAIVGWQFENHCNLRSIADVLAEVFPRAKIWLVVRRQDKWVESAYSQLLKIGFATSVERYLNYEDGRFGAYNIGLFNGPNVDARDLDWERFDAYYRRLFGADAVLTLPFELFVADSEEFLARFYAFAGLDAPLFPATDERVNERWSPIAVAVAKLVNKVPMPIKRALRERVGSDWHPSAVLSRTVIPRLPAWTPGIGKASYVSEELGAALLELHRASNRALGERIGLDLSHYGY